MKLLFLIFVMLTSFFILSFLGVLLAIPLFHTSLSGILAITSEPPGAENVALLKYLQLVQSLSLFVLPPLLFVLLEKTSISRYFGFDRRVKAGLYVSTFFLAVALVPVNNFLSEWNQGIHFPESLSALENMLRNLEKSADQLTQAFLVMPSWGAYLYNLLLIAVLAAVGEEMTFRGVIQPLFIRWIRSPHAGIFITGAVFSFFHFQFFGFFPRWLLGILFGYLFYWSRTLWVPIMAHFFNNALAVTAYFFAGSAGVEEKYDKIGVVTRGGVDEVQHSTIGMGIVPLILGILTVILIMYSFYRNRKYPDQEAPAGVGEV